MKPTPPGRPGEHEHAGAFPSGDDEAIQPTNASADGFRLAGDGETAGWIVRTGDRDVAAGAASWWRPLPAPVAPEGDPERPVYLPAGADEYGPLMHAWGAVYDADPATGEPAREPGCRAPGRARPA